MLSSSSATSREQELFQAVKTEDISTILKILSKSRTPRTPKKILTGSRRPSINAQDGDGSKMAAKISASSVPVRLKITVRFGSGLALQLALVTFRLRRSGVDGRVWPADGRLRALVKWPRRAELGRAASPEFARPRPASSAATPPSYRRPGRCVRCAAIAKASPVACFGSTPHESQWEPRSLMTRSSQRVPILQISRYRRHWDTGRCRLPSALLGSRPGVPPLPPFPPSQQPSSSHCLSFVPLVLLLQGMFSSSLSSSLAPSH
ncbi:hypothetical protein ISCGN_021648 [Ixodes scapularis]